MIQIKDALPAGRQGSGGAARQYGDGVGDTVLLKTYMLRLHVTGQDVDFRPVLCETHAQALAEARLWLDEHPECDAIDVLLGHAELFLIGRPDTE